MGLSSSDRRKIIAGILLQIKGGTVATKGHCMSSVIENNWKIKIMPCRSTQVKLGDIIAFNINVPSIKRAIGKITKKGKTFFLNKGDNDFSFGMVSEDSLIGRVTEIVEPPLGNVDNRQWVYQNIPLLILSFIACKMYSSVFYLKYVFLGDRTNWFFKQLHLLYWRLWYNILLKRINGKSL